MTEPFQMLMQRGGGMIFGSHGDPQATAAGGQEGQGSTVKPGDDGPGEAGLGRNNNTPASGEDRGVNEALLVALTGPRSRLDSLASLADADQATPPARRPSGAPRQTQRRLSEAEIVALAMEYQAGATLKELARSYGVHHQTAAAHLRRLAVPLRRRGVVDDDVDEVVRLYGEGWSLTRLGAKFGCDAETIRQTLLRSGVKTRAPWERG